MRKVLVVDETLGVTNLLEDRLRATGVEVLRAASGAAATAAIEREQPDLVVCDVYLPDTDGYRVCDFVRAHPSLAATPVLLMSDSVDRTVLARAERAGFDDVLRRPWAAAELAGRIEELLALHAPAGRAPEGFGADAEETGAAGALAALAATPGVTFAALADREGFVIDWAGSLDVDPEIAAAVACRLAESSEGSGAEIGQGALRTAIYQYERGALILEGAGAEARLAAVVHDLGALEAVRRCARQLALTPGPVGGPVTP